MYGAVDIILSGCVITVSRLIPLSKLLWAVDILVEITAQSISHKRGFGFRGPSGSGLDYPAMRTPAKTLGLEFFLPFSFFDNRNARG